MDFEEYQNKRIGKGIVLTSNLLGSIYLDLKQETLKLEIFELLNCLYPSNFFLTSDPHQ